MTSFNAPSVPFTFRRKSSSSSTSFSFDGNVYHPDYSPPSSPPLLSSSPLLTPLHLTRSHEHAEWQAGDYSDDPDTSMYNQKDHVSPSWSGLGPSGVPYKHTPLPSLITKVTEHTRQGYAWLPYSISPCSSSPRTSYFYPQGESAIADDTEEYDLESMDIHIRETYFATSAERGRWMSSPILPCVPSQPVPPARGHSSPIKKPTNTSPPAKRHRRIQDCTVDEQISTSLPEDRDESMRSLSPLPPSSPISPLSSLSHLGDDCEDDAFVDPSSNSNNYPSLERTPELSISVTTCTSPVEPVRPPTSHKPISIASALSPSGPSSRPLDSFVSNSFSTIDAHEDTHISAGFESDSILSPLSQFELDLPEAESPSLPLSDVENRLHPEQGSGCLDVTADAVRSRGGLSSVQLLPVRPKRKFCQVPSDATGRTAKRDGPSNSKVRRTKRPVPCRSHSPCVNPTSGTENRASSHSERPRKKARLSRRGEESTSRKAKSRSKRTGVIKANLPLQSPSCHIPNSASVDGTDGKISEAVDLPPRPASVSADEADVGFHTTLTGMLIEAFATSRATSMDSAALYLVLTQAHPHLGVERSKQELLADIATVLEAGRVRCGMFEKVDSSGEGSRHKTLESRWFYISERDEDGERASLMSAIMPRQKRNETKKYKQYYYRPLDKMSRWDPEDEL